MPAPLTVTKIRIYQRFGGNRDAWSQSSEKAVMTEADWQLIDELTRQLQAAATGRASRRFEELLEERLADCTEDGSALALLHELAAG